LKKRKSGRPVHRFRFSSNSLRQLASVSLIVELRLHAIDRTFAREDLAIFLSDKWILHPIRDRGAAFRDVHGGVIGMDLAGRARFTARIVRTEPRGKPQRFARCAEVLMVPSCAAGSR